MGQELVQSIREKLLTMLLENKDTYISGQMISEKLGCSRTAVWKHISELKKEGYEVEGLQKRGYRLISTPNNIRPHDIRSNLNTKFIGQKIVFQEVVTSTQELAQKLAQEGAKEGTVVVAEQQSKGRGRLGRAWESPKGTGIWMSLIIRPNIPPFQAPQLTLLTAVAIVQGIKKATGISCEIKWPNDILINGKKIVGILTEMQAESDRIQSIIIGIGMNVNTTSFPDDLKQKATSLLIENDGKEIRRAQLLQAIFEQFEILYHEYLKNGFEVIKLRWESYAVSLGKFITARTLTGEITGYAKGITDQGVLLLEDQEGKIHEIYSADIEISSQS